MTKRIEITEEMRKRALGRWKQMMADPFNTCIDFREILDAAVNPPDPPAEPIPVSEGMLTAGREAYFSPMRNAENANPFERVYRAMEAQRRKEGGSYVGVERALHEVAAKLYPDALFYDREEMVGAAVGAMAGVAARQNHTRKSDP